MHHGRLFPRQNRLLGVPHLRRRHPLGPSMRRRPLLQLKDRTVRLAHERRLQTIHAEANDQSSFINQNHQLQIPIEQSQPQQQAQINHCYKQQRRRRRRHRVLSREHLLERGLRLHAASQRLPKVHLLPGRHGESLHVPGRPLMEADGRQLRVAARLRLSQLAG